MSQTPAISPRRAAGSRHVARALWYAKPGVIELRSTSLPPLKPGEARVRTLFSGISRGTERLVFNGRVPISEYERMRAPLQEGRFPFPVKYGYCATGTVEDGPEDLIGQSVFCLHPHQDMFIAPAAMLAVLPTDVPPRRATLAANMETALNALWDSGAGPGDTIVVVGAGILGLLVAALAAKTPGANVTVIDVIESRAPLVQSLGASFTTPANTPTGADVVFHTTATAAGIDTSIAACGLEATVVELSWYGDAQVNASLGGAFHSRRLKLVSSQVGHVAPSHRPRWSHHRRLGKAIELLGDSVFGPFVESEIAFTDLPAALPAILTGSTADLPPVVCYQR